MSNSYTTSFAGAIPPGVTIQGNIYRALEFQRTHTRQETIAWFNDAVRNNKNGHLPQEQSMDYKQLDADTRAPGEESIYTDFGNYNYGAVGRALGISDEILLRGAGYQQQMDNGKSVTEALIEMLTDQVNYGDNPGDQSLIQDGIETAKDLGNTNSNIENSDVIFWKIMKDGVEFVDKQSESLIKAIDNAVDNLIETGKPFVDVLNTIGDALSKLGSPRGQRH